MRQTKVEMKDKLNSKRIWAARGGWSGRWKSKEEKRNAKKRVKGKNGAEED